MSYWKQFRDIERNEIIVVGVDTSVGCGDYTAAQFVSKNKLDVPIVYHSPETVSSLTADLALKLERICDITGYKPLVAYERANSGATEMERLAALNRLNKYEIFRMPVIGKIDNQETERLGWDTNAATRPQMLENLKRYIDKKLLKIYDIDTVAELLSFVVVYKNASRKAQAERNAHDDLVMSLAIATELLDRAEPDKLITMPTVEIVRPLMRDERYKGRRSY
jgi:hypothetical protein